MKDLPLPQRLIWLYSTLDQHFGYEPHWWPIISDQPQLEVLIGAVLVQQTRWKTVEEAMRRLKAAGLLTFSALAGVETQALAELIRPCAFHMQKAPGLQAICRYILEQHSGDIGAMLRQERRLLRAELLGLPRIGRETADTIMLYGGGHPLFVVDAYTRRLFERLDLYPGFNFTRARYDDIQILVETALPVDLPDLPIPPLPAQSGAIPIQQPATRFYWQFHALIVEACIHHCLASRPRQEQPGAHPTFVDQRKCALHCRNCMGCPLRFECVTYHKYNNRIS